MIKTKEMQWSKAKRVITLRLTAGNFRKDYL